MGIEHVLAFNAVLLASIASPGPSLLFLTRTTLAQGRRAGIAAALGLGVMASGWTLAALLGLQSLFELFPWAYAALKTIGAAYLIWIAVQTWRHAREPVAAAALPSGRQSFVSGVLVNLANPKSVLFAGAVIVVIFPPDIGAAAKAGIWLNHLAVEWTVQPALALLLSTGAVRRRYLGLKPVLDRIAAGILGALGLRLLVER